MISHFHDQANCAAERTNLTMKQVLRTVVLAKQHQQNVDPTSNCLRLLDMVEIAINNAQISNTGLRPFYLNIVYHLHFWFDVPNFDESRLKGDKTIQVNDRIARCARIGHLSTVRCTTSRHERMHLATEQKANYQFKVGQDILINQRKHCRNQWGPSCTPDSESSGIVHE